MDERAARISLLAAELNAEAVATFAEIQGMMVANEQRKRNDQAPAYGEEAFIKIRDDLMSSSGNITERMRNL